MGPLREKKGGKKETKRDKGGREERGGKKGEGGERRGKGVATPSLKTGAWGIPASSTIFLTESQSRAKLVVGPLCEKVVIMSKAAKWTSEA
jgi:hypothetical protein